MPRTASKAVLDGDIIIGWRCAACNQAKRLEEFARDASNKTTGRQRMCRACHRVRARERKPARKHVRVTVQLDLAQHEQLALLADRKDMSMSRCATELVVRAMRIEMDPHAVVQELDGQRPA